MQELTVKWFPDSAARFIELLKTNDWNTAARQLMKDPAATKDKK